MDYTNKTKKAVISIKGMTCHACVKTIEQNLTELPGVISIKVSLSNQEGVVIFSSSNINPEMMVQEIEDSGFEASLKSVASVDPVEEMRSMVSIELHGGILYNVIFDKF